MQKKHTSKKSQFKVGPNPKNFESGAVILVGIIFMAILLTMSAAVWGYTTLQVKSSRQSIESTKVLHIAEAGLDKALYELNLDNDFSGQTDEAFGEGEYTTAVTAINPTTKRITSTGYYPNSSNPTQERTVQTDIELDLNNVAFNFGVQVGEGGLTMANNSTVNGNVYSNGSISGSGTIRGSATVAGGLPANTDQSCQTYFTGFNLNATDRRDGAQKFTPSVTGGLSKASVYIKKTGSPSNISVRVMNNGISVPGTSQLGSSQTIQASSVGFNYGWVDVVFSTPPQLTQGSTYWLVLDTSGSTSAYYSWGQDSDNSCQPGVGYYASSYSAGSPGWTNTNKDFNFKTFIGGTVTSISQTMVTGSARANTLIGCDVWSTAYFQVNNGCAIGGTQYPGTPDSPAIPLPVTDGLLADWREAAENGTIYNSSQNLNGTHTIGPAKINGDLVLSSGATLYVEGPIWVKGNINISNNASVYIASSVGPYSVAIMADNSSDPFNSGKITISNNAVIQGNNMPGSYPMLLSTSTNNNNAISISNNSNGAIYYATSGVIQLSNNAGGFQITGYGISMSNNSIVSYQSGLQNINFSNGPGGSWVRIPGTYLMRK